MTGDFDFWLGTWEVHSREGVFLGRNRVEAILDGTVLQEHWEGATGGRGTSLNAYVPGKGGWRQAWVDDLGNFLDLEGALTGASMILCGISSSTAGPLSERITWTPLVDGRVLQLWEQSVDDGATWKVVFEGFYTRIS